MIKGLYDDSPTFVGLPQVEFMHTHTLFHTHTPPPPSSTTAMATLLVPSQIVKRIGWRRCLGSGLGSGSKVHAVGSPHMPIKAQEIFKTKRPATNHQHTSHIYHQ
jgi:hypothetical protein